MIEFLADSSQSTGGMYQWVHFYFPLILAMGLLWAVMILPKRKQDRTRQQMMNNMKRGDEVQTIGGIIGKVVEARDEKVLVKVDESSNTKIWFSRSAIAKVTAEEAKTAVK